MKLFIFINIFNLELSIITLNMQKYLLALKKYSDFWTFLFSTKTYYEGGIYLGYAFVTDKGLKINTWGRELVDLTGRSELDTLGRKYFEVLPRIYLGEEDALSLALRKGKALSLKKYIVNCLYGHIIADLYIKPVRNGRRHIKGVEVVISPETTCSYIKKVQNSQRLIDIGKKASMLAHGVRNPLNAIKGAVIYLSEKYSEEPDLIEFTTIIEKEINRLDTFIAKFLSASTSDASILETDVNNLLRKILTFMSFQLENKKITPLLTCGNIPAVMIGTFQLEQAILNILNNSTEAMSSGGTLTVETNTETRSGKKFVLINISDTGPGLGGGAEKVSLPPVKEDDGHGFGLFLTREIIQSFNGHMEIESSKGKGTRISLFLPVEREE